MKLLMEHDRNKILKNIFLMRLLRVAMLNYLKLVLVSRVQVSPNFVGILVALGCFITRCHLPFQLLPTPLDKVRENSDEG